MPKYRDRRRHLCFLPVWGEGCSFYWLLRGSVPQASMQDEVLNMWIFAQKECGAGLKGRGAVILVMRIIST